MTIIEGIHQLYKGWITANREMRTKSASNTTRLVYVEARVWFHSKIKLHLNTLKMTSSGPCAGPKQNKINLKTFNSKTLNLKVFKWFILVLRQHVPEK
jgi:hypothetical protein